MRFSNDDCIGPRIVPFQYRMSSLSSVVVCLCQREDDEDKGESSTRQNSHAERTKNNKRRFSCIRQISCPNGLAQSKRGETPTTPTPTTLTKQAQRERRATRRRKSFKRRAYLYRRARASSGASSLLSLSPRLPTLPKV